MNGLLFARLSVALVAGAMFGFGLSLSGMVDPARVIGFLDVGSGHWDPSLMFVLGGAVAVAIPGVLLAHRLSKPVFDDRFHLPTKAAIDRRLIAGSAIFGIGWGLAGFCPGPALSAVATGQPVVLLFVFAMTSGMMLHDRVFVLLTPFTGEKR
ncbi:MAG TPA: YeeE/YedE family protein [Advenella sp.]|nr:YeeE/YedE family protein [Advenella sp.]